MPRCPRWRSLLAARLALCFLPEDPQEASIPEKCNSGVSSGSGLFGDAVRPALWASPTASEAARPPPGGAPSAGTPIRSQCQLSRL